MCLRGLVLGALQSLVVGPFGSRRSLDSCALRMGLDSESNMVSRRGMSHGLLTGMGWLIKTFSWTE